MAVLGYIPKSKRGLGLAFEAHFVHDEKWKMANTSFKVKK